MEDRLVYRGSEDALPDGVRRAACISSCGRYRYSLTRTWGDGDGVLFIGLNPSTADHETDDPTVRRCMGFARSWGYTRLIMVNLFAFRSTDPLGLATVDDPVGPLNERVVQDLADEAALVVAAWGNGGHQSEREQVVRSILREAHCLGLTKKGSPRHPLYVPADTQPVLYSRQDGSAECQPPRLALSGR